MLMGSHTTRLLLEQAHKCDRVKHVNGIPTSLLLEQHTNVTELNMLMGSHTTRILLEQAHKCDRVKNVNGITHNSSPPGTGTQM